MLIAAVECLRELKKNSETAIFIDVRSEGEFFEAAIPGFQNSPILNSEERHLVGTEYKKSGREAAIHLAQTLTDPFKQQRISNWLSLSKNKSHKYLMCWRGGLRSQFAQDSLKENGVDFFRVKGGYKALRNELLKTLTTLPEVIVLSGRTGSGKTEMIERIPSFLNLEKLANHRGSVFGADFNTPQPRQATFENAVAISIFENENPIWVEDESVRIGYVSIPRPLKEKMNEAPVVVLESSLEERSQRIYLEYVQKLVDRGLSPETLCDKYCNYLMVIKKYLGGALSQELVRDLKEIFADAVHFEKMNPWIQKILVQYYDKKYDHAFQRLNRKILFKGNSKEVEAFIKDRTRGL